MTKLIIEGDFSNKRMNEFLRYTMTQQWFQTWKMEPSPDKPREGVLYNMPLYGFHFADINLFVVAKSVDGRDNYVGREGFPGGEEVLRRELEKINYMNVVIDYG